MLTAFALLTGFLLDLAFGDPKGIPHPVVLIGKLISACESLFRKLFSKTPLGERRAGGAIFLTTASVSFAIPAAVLYAALKVSPWLYYLFESVMVFQILAAKSLKDESMKVKDAADRGDVEGARRAVSMIVGRDTKSLDLSGILRAAVETVAENAADGVAAPVFYIMIGGAPLGFFYKAVNTMDSMLGYVEEPYKNIGYIPAKMDDFFNFLPSRICALLMLLAGALLHLDFRRGVHIFKRDRFNHKSPNSAQTESVMAGLLGLRLAGDASYHGVLHKKPFIGEALREVEREDIARANRLMIATSTLCVGLAFAMRLLACYLLRGKLWL